jgi:hypothetical protein
LLTGWFRTPSTYLQGTREKPLSAHVSLLLDQHQQYMMARGGVPPGPPEQQQQHVRLLFRMVTVDFCGSMMLQDLATHDHQPYTP